MNGENIKAPNITRHIFESHFSEAFEAEEYSRALAIFNELGAFNERGIAIQLHVAKFTGKLPEVLEAYEKLIGPDSFLHLIPDPSTRAAEVRYFKDAIYTNVMLDRDEDPFKAMETVTASQVPKIFDLMETPGGF